MCILLAAVASLLIDTWITDAKAKEIISLREFKSNGLALAIACYGSCIFHFIDIFFSYKTYVNAVFT